MSYFDKRVPDKVVFIFVVILLAYVIMYAFFSSVFAG